MSGWSYPENYKPSSKQQKRIIHRSLEDRMHDFKDFDMEPKRMALSLLMHQVREGKL